MKFFIIIKSEIDKKIKCRSIYSKNIEKLQAYCNKKKIINSEIVCIISDDNLIVYDCFKGWY